MTHDHEKQRYSKGDVFGFRACDERDYRFAGKLEYQILEVIVNGGDADLSLGRYVQSSPINSNNE